jgi:hypothetical protein
MTRTATIALLGVLVVTAIGGTRARRAEAFRTDVLVGACYCRAEGKLECTAGLTEAECRRKCEDALCDDWFWKERLQCWNWGYGG